MKRSFLVVSMIVAGLTACGSPSDDSSSTTVAVAEPPQPSDAPSSTATTPPAPTEPATTVRATTEPATTPAATESVRFEDPDGVYAVEYPSAPVAQQLEVPLPDGTSLPITAYLGDVEGGALISSCVEYQGATPIDAAAVLLEARDGALDNVGATLDTSADIELQDRPGIEFTGTAPSGDIHGRTYLDGTLLCQTLVAGAADSVAANALSFLDSFEFLQEAA